MKARNRMVPISLAIALALGGCADMGSFGGTKYGDASGTLAGQSEREGRVAAVEIVKVAGEYKLGIGTVAGAVAGGLLGSQVGSGSGRTTATVVGAAAGAAAGTVAESKLVRKDVQRVTVQMYSGGQVTIVQPVDGRIVQNMNVRVDGAGETARVVPR